MYLLNKIIQKKNKPLFDQACSEIRHTKPLRYKPDPVITIISMVSNSTVDMFLVAVKPFMFQFVDANIEAINDGSLTEKISNY